MSRVHGALDALKQRNSVQPWVPSVTLQRALDDLYDLPNLDIAADVATLAPWLELSLAAASAAAFGRPPAYMGEGGSIPFMAMLGEKFPAAQFVVTGVLGPHSNAHGPNEFLHIPTAKRVTAVVANVLADHAKVDHKRAA